MNMSVLIQGIAATNTDFSMMVYMHQQTEMSPA